VKRDYGDYFKWSIIVDFLGFNREGSEEMRLPRMRRQKFVPQKKSELDLFNVKEHIQQVFISISYFEIFRVSILMSSLGQNMTMKLSSQRILATFLIIV